MTERTKPSAAGLKYYHLAVVREIAGYGYGTGWEQHQKAPRSTVELYGFGGVGRELLSEGITFDVVIRDLINGGFVDERNENGYITYDLTDYGARMLIWRVAPPRFNGEGRKP